MNIIVTEYEFLQLHEPFELAQVAMTDYVVKSHELKADLFYRLLKVSIIEHLEGIAVYEEHRVALDLSVPRLHETLIS